VTLWHKGKINDEKIHEILSTAKEISQLGVMRLMESNEEKVTDLEIQRAIGRVEILPKKVARELIEENSGRNYSKLNFAKKMLTAVKDLPLLQSYYLNNKVGEFLGLYNGLDARKSRLSRLVRG